MTELPKGMFCSILIHGTVLGLFLFMSQRMSVLGSNRRDIDLILAQTPNPVPNKPPGPTDVGDIAHPPAPDDVLPADPENVRTPPVPTPPVPKPPRPVPPAPVPPKPVPPEPVPPKPVPPEPDVPPDTPAPVIDKKAPPTRPDKAQVSPTGPEILKKQKEKELQRQKAEDEKRLARIRQGLRKAAPAKPVRVPPISPPTVAGVTASDYERRISSQVQNVLVSMNKGGGGGGAAAGAAQAGAADAQGDAFGAALSAALHEYWNQPTRAEVGRGNPTVGVSITLGADGKLMTFQITRSSGHAAMDDSVKRLFVEHHQFPAPSAFGSTDSVRKIDITFELDPTGSA